MEKKLTKNEKGITLVALIITIIVLLILAVVSIRAITGDNILGRSETAKNKYVETKEQEKNTIADYEKYLDGKNNPTSKVEYYTNSGETIACAIDYENMELKMYRKGEDGKFIYAGNTIINEITKNTGNPFNIIVDGNTFSIRENATVLKRGTSIKDYIQDGKFYLDLNNQANLKSDEDILKLNNSIKDLITE